MDLVDVFHLPLLLEALWSAGIRKGRSSSKRPIRQEHSQTLLQKHLYDPDPNPNHNPGLQLNHCVLDFYMI